MNITKDAALAWLRQPTTVAALATLTGTAVALSLHQMSVDAAAAVAAGALVGLVLPDNSTARSGAALLAADVLAAVRAPSAATVGHLVSDAVGLAVAVEQPSGAAVAVAVTSPSVEVLPAAAEVAAVAIAAAGDAKA